MIASEGVRGGRGSASDRDGGGGPADARERAALDELSAYTLQLGDPDFIHQHVVDAYGAQTARPGGKPIAITFALVGLYLAIEKGFTGRQVQRAHMYLARRKRPWPVFPLPTERGSLRVTDVVEHPAGPERNDAIHAWARSVWGAYRASHAAIAERVERWMGPDG